jgi:hypothetical protein
VVGLLDEIFGEVLAIAAHAMQRQEHLHGLAGDGFTPRRADVDAPNRRSGQDAADARRVAKAVDDWLRFERGAVEAQVVGHVLDPVHGFVWAGEHVPGWVEPLLDKCVMDYFYIRQPHVICPSIQPNI